MGALERNNVRIFGKGSKTILFAHGFGCDQTMWRFVAAAFLEDYRVVLFDQVGTGQSDTSRYTVEKYSNLNAYADDILEICAALDLNDTILVGHSVAAMICMLAAIKEASRFSKLIMIAPSPCYINKDGYEGGFEEADIHTMLDFLNANFGAWAQTMAPTIMGNADRPALTIELGETFCKFHPVAARHFAKLTFLSDNRADLEKLTVPALIMQCSADAIAPEFVGQYLHAKFPSSTYAKLQATGHCPHMSAPDETVAVMKEFIENRTKTYADASADHTA